jgi:hypothetical protein
VHAAVGVERFRRVAFGVDGNESEADLRAQVARQSSFDALHVLHDDWAGIGATGEEHRDDLHAASQLAEVERLAVVVGPGRIELVEGFVGERSRRFDVGRAAGRLAADAASRDEVPQDAARTAMGISHRVSRFINLSRNGIQDCERCSSPEAAAETEAHGSVVVTSGLEPLAEELPLHALSPRASPVTIAVLKSATHSQTSPCRSWMPKKLRDACRREAIFPATGRNAMRPIVS